MYNSQTLCTKLIVSPGGGLNSHVFAEIISLANLFLAWQEFKQGKTKKLDVRQFEFNLEDNLFELHSELVLKTYRHSDYTAFYITDPKLRHIRKACVRDRVLHHAVFRILYPIFDKVFIFDSYSCRVGKGTHQAVKRLKQFCQKASRNNFQNLYALKCDVKRFFDSVDHDVLLEIIKRKVSDEETLWLVGLIIASYQTVSNKGLPIGNVTSQLFANIYLNELDQFIKHNLKVECYLRYCDDFIILVEDPGVLLSQLEKIKNFLGDRLGLTIHPNKVSIRTYRQGIDFLGYIVRPYCVNLRTKTKNRLISRINAENSASYLGLLRHCNGRKIEKKVLAKLSTAKVQFKAV